MQQQQMIMYFGLLRPTRSRSTSRSRSVTPSSDRISPIIRKRKARVQRNLNKRMNRTIEALSKISEDSDDSFCGSPSTSLQNRKFSGMKNIRLADYGVEEEESNSKSVYDGAGIKLDAFDRYHKTLNEVSDFTFSVADAALILKLLTPDIIKKILPLMNQPTTNAKKQTCIQKKQDSQSECGEDALDYEISEINKDQSESIKSNMSSNMMPKRPDASRSMRLSSPGSNSCSPVSAAVQALISISAPVTDNTMTQPISSQAKLDYSNESGEISEVMADQTFDGGTVFIPLSKPTSLTKDFSDSVVTPIPKPANVSATYCKENSNTSDPMTCSIEAPDEVSESMNIMKSDTFAVSDVQVTAVPSTILDHVSNQGYTIQDSASSKLLVTTQSMNQSLSSNQHISGDNFSKSNEGEHLPHLPQSSLVHDDPLPHFNLLLNTPGMPVDLPCGLHSPFTHPLPASPMTSMMNTNIVETTQVTTSIKDPVPTLPPSDVSITESNVSHNAMGTHNATSTAVDIQMSFHPKTSTSIMLSTSLPSTEQDSTYIEQSEFVHEEVPSSSNVRIQNPLRTILPKPCSDSTGGLPIVSVISTSHVTNSISQISPVIKIEEKKPMMYGNSIPPNQIFTKINPVANPSTMTPTTLAAIPTSQQRQIFQNQMFHFSPGTMEAFMFQQQNQAKEPFKNFFFQNLPPPQLNNIKQKTPEDRTFIVSQNEPTKTFIVSQNEPKKTVTTTTSKPEQPNRRGNLEAVSALLSMGSENVSSTDKQAGDDTFRSIILDSLKKEGGNIQVTFTPSGTVRIKDVEIDPQEHGIKKGNFECGKCKRVFTSVLYLTRHIKRVCPDMSQRKWKCDRCSKAFRHPFGLQQHIYTHTGERPHKCTQCAKAFYSSNDLRRHMRTHSGERPYQCTLCDKSFSTTISLKTHNYIHTGERPHKCPHCVKTFATSSKLSRHIVTHSDKRPFPCDQCAKTFNRSGDLRRHYSQHHDKAHSLLECDQCNKVFATQKCLLNHKSTHNRDMNAIDTVIHSNNLTDNQDLLTRTYDEARFAVN